LLLANGPYARMWALQQEKHDEHPEHVGQSAPT